MTDDVTWVDMGLAEFMRAVSILDQTRIKIGIVAPRSEEMSADGRLTLGALAHILEYGAKNIPRRPFINGVIKPGQALAESKNVAQAILRFDHPDHAMREAGQKFVAQLRDHAELGRMAPNAASTIRRKGFDHPLVDTLKLISAIDYELVHDGGRGAALGGAVDLEKPVEVDPVTT